MPAAANGIPPASGCDSLPLSRLFLVGQRLGDGAFGVVHSCTRLCDGEELAVKLINVGISKPADVWREAQMLESLAHPNIVRFHGLFPEGAHMCIIMEKLSGGDLVDGLQTYLDKWGGNIEGQNIVSAVRQMASSIQYLHHRLVVHRDVKGDNFLMDRPDILDPECRIVLTDFGSACRLERPGERLSTEVGTMKFSAPEIFDNNYSAKVDVWALGVVMYGLATGRFPFKNKAEVRFKRMSIPRAVHPPFADLIDRMLTKDEAARLDSDQAMRHPYMSADRGAWLEPSVQATLVRGDNTSGGENVEPVATPRSHAARALCRGKGAAPPPREAGGSPESSGDAAARSLKLATAQLQALAVAPSAATTSAAPPPAGGAGPAPPGARLEGPALASGAERARSRAGCVPQCLLGLGLVCKASAKAAAASAKLVD
ncbi:unnamed protein product [Prorocentrum cordatum]|uniref:non-specific serine/threonine protein kinase n=1 Tax=Prorocentrum cordatum TaxID=2364126 RepID=A0ABN9YFS3_9DINO|nr:unnamed protein product [Polarella glacialis]